MTRLQPRPTRSATLVPYATLFRTKGGVRLNLSRAPPLSCAKDICHGQLNRQQPRFRLRPRRKTARHRPVERVARAEDRARNRTDVDQPDQDQRGGAGDAHDGKRIGAGKRGRGGGATGGGREKKKK